MDERFDTIIDNGTVIDNTGNTGWVCPKCGTSVAPTAMFCPICGGKRTNESLAPGESMICG
jgi:rubrerythrin